MKILALDPYYGGSHKAFLDCWVANSSHKWTILGLPDRRWKWRMRHSSLTISTLVKQKISNGENWDVIFATDMLNLPEFLGLTPEMANIPTVIYFHENQFTYPVRAESPRDLHYGYSNFLSAVQADQVWFNSAFHRDDFLTASSTFLGRLPDYQHREQIEVIRQKSSVQYPGVQLIKPADQLNDPPRILWSSRWEHDKNPGLFFAAIEQLANDGIDFRIAVLGENFTERPPIFEIAKEKFAHLIDHFGYAKSSEQYQSLVANSDIIVSTADHEFYGIAVIEALSAGLYPILPSRLSYPELMKIYNPLKPRKYLYDGTLESLVRKLKTALAFLATDRARWDRQKAHNNCLAFSASCRAAEMDQQLETIIKRN